MTARAAASFETLHAFVEPRDLHAQFQAFRSVIGSLVAIGAVVGGSAAAFAYTAGWFSPQRFTPDKLIEALAPPGGPSLGHRRNHAKGICFTGVFESNGSGVEHSRAQVFEPGRYPAMGRFN